MIMVDRIYPRGKVVLPKLWINVTVNSTNYPCIVVALRNQAVVNDRHLVSLVTVHCRLSLTNVDGLLTFACCPVRLAIPL